MCLNVDDLDEQDILDLTRIMQDVHDARNVHTCQHKHTRDIMMNVSIPVDEDIDKLQSEGWSLSRGVEVA